MDMDLLPEYAGLIRLDNEKVSAAVVLDAPVFLVNFNKDLLITNRS